MSTREKDKRATTVGCYNIGTLLGKGGVGTVYQGLDVENGDFVAIKQVNLQYIPKSQRHEIMQEIDLLKNLNHPNIVKYVKYEQSEEYLYIVLEYVESGSLSTIVKKFGKFPEPLVCVYITQVLEGLAYLHDQGVVHRDIKGANILATKDGIMKLADFGVATKITSDSVAVVGTPYWMAPEIIEMQGASTASDIWSVGCTVIELLTGEPPYYDLNNMAALYHIVQDDYPPLPEGITPALKEWLMECFQKDPALRISAHKLLKHKWIQSNKKKEIEIIDTINVTKKIQDYNIKLKSQMEDRICAIPNKKYKKTHPIRLLPPPESVSDEWSDDFALAPNEGQATVASSGEIAVPSINSDIADSPASSRKDDTLSALKGLLRTTDINIDMLGNSAGTNSAPESPVPSMRATSPIPNRAATPTQIVPSTPPQQHNPPASPPISSTPPQARSGGLVKKFSNWKVLNLKALPDRSIGGNGIARWKEDENNNPEYGNKGSFNGNGSLDLASRFYKRFHSKKDSNTQGLKESPRSPRGGPSNLGGEGDIFDEFEEQLDVEVDLDAHLVKDQLTKMSDKIYKLMTKLHPEQNEDVILSTAYELIDIFRDNPTFKRQLIRQKGVLPIVEMLEVSNPRVLYSILQVVNQIIENNEDIHENLCLVGGIPCIMRFSGPEHSLPIRLECAKFISTMCSTSVLTLQMVIACRGLPVLVDMLATPYDESKVLVWMAIDAVLSVFELQTTTPKKDFCRIFARSGFLKVMARVLKCVIEDEEAREKKYAEKIANILVIFSGAEDTIVRQMMSHEEVIAVFFSFFTYAPPAVLVKILKCIKQILSDHNTRAPILRAGAMHHLLGVMCQYELHSDNVNHMHNHILGAISHLCHLDPSAQFQAVEAGIVPHLQNIIQKQANALKQQQANPLKQQALPLLFDLAHVTAAHDHLWKHECVEFYLDLVCEEYWEGAAMSSLSAWLEASLKVEEILLQPQNVTKIVEGFKAAKTNSFVKYVEALVRALLNSHLLARALSTSSLFVRILVERLQQRAVAQVCVNMLKILRLLFENHPQPQKMVEEHKLVPLVKKFTQDKVLVKNLALRLLAAMGAPPGSPTGLRHSHHGRRASLTKRPI